MKIIFYFSGLWYTQTDKQDPVALHPNDLRETFQLQESNKKEEDGYYWHIAISPDEKSLVFIRTSIMEVGL